MSLNGKITALNKFIPKATDNCIPFFNFIKKNKNFEWSEDCRKAFKKLKNHLEKSLILTSPVEGENLYLYMVVSKYVVGSVLIKEENGTQFPVYHIIKRLKKAKTKYPVIEKLTYYFNLTTRKLRSYFQAYPTKALTSFPTRKNFSKLLMLGRLVKWEMELSQHKIGYHP